MTPEVEAVYDFCTELSTTHEVSDATFNRLRHYLNDQQIVDLTVLSGHLRDTGHGAEYGTGERATGQGVAFQARRAVRLVDSSC